MTLKSLNVISCCIQYNKLLTMDQFNVESRFMSYFDPVLNDTITDNANLEKSRICSR